MRAKIGSFGNNDLGFIRREMVTRDEFGAGRIRRIRETNATGETLYVPRRLLQTDTVRRRSCDKI